MNRPAETVVGSHLATVLPLALNDPPSGTRGPPIAPEHPCRPANWMIRCHGERAARGRHRYLCIGAPVALSLAPALLGRNARTSGSDPVLSFIAVYGILPLRPVMLLAALNQER